jgi:hypothetical protein
VTAVYGIHHDSTDQARSRPRRAGPDYWILAPRDRHWSLSTPNTRSCRRSATGRSRIAAATQSTVRAHTSQLGGVPIVLARDSTSMHSRTLWPCRDTIRSDAR